MRIWRGARAILLLAALVAAPASLAHATEVHSLYDASCQRTSGVLVNVSADQVVLVDLTGNLVVRPRAGIAGIALHKTLENPLGRIALSAELRAHLRDVWVGDDTSPTFTGWTTAFFDDLLLFFDLDGQTHVLDPEEIRRIRPTTLATASVTPRSHAAVELAFPSAVVPCGGGAVPPEAVLPSRVIADRIKVGDYLGKLEQRYRDQSGFEERTRVYAEPFLFGLESRLGLLYDPEWAFPFPLYFRWSNGRPYRFQSLSVVGNASHEWLPFVKPTISARSDVKSHFFHATFIGHVLALPAGTDPFIIDDDAELGPDLDAQVDHSYNYLLLMGADYWRLSASAGAAYLGARLQVFDTTTGGQNQRTLRASGLSPSVRLRYQGPALQLRALYFRTRASGPVADAVFEDDIEPGDADPFPGQRYRWRSDTVRLGATWKPHPTVEVMADQIGTRAAYWDNADDDFTLALHALEFVTSGELAVSFGRYVTVKGMARLYVKKADVTQPVPFEVTHVQARFGGALEFVF
jgi:hypothetical protein